MLDDGLNPPAPSATSRRATRPWLSLVMPVHEGQAWIDATLRSLANEPMDGVEIIAIDSSPSDATADIIRHYADRLPIRIIERHDLDRWQTKTNFGVEQAAADWVCMLHQDDVWIPGRVAAVRRWLAAAPEAVLHLAPTQIIDRNGRSLGRWRCPLPDERLLNGDFVIERLLVQNFISVLAPVFRRSAFLSAHGVDPDLWYTADWDMWLKLAGAGPVMYHHDVTTGFRIHGSSLTVTGSRNAQDFESQMVTVLDRHLGRLSPTVRPRVEAAARASIRVNVSLASAATGSWKNLGNAVWGVLKLGPTGALTFLRDSRLKDRLMPRLRAKLAGGL